MFSLILCSYQKGFLTWLYFCMIFRSNFSLYLFNTFCSLVTLPTPRWKLFTLLRILSLTFWARTLQILQKPHLLSTDIVNTAKYHHQWIFDSTWSKLKLFFYISVVGRLRHLLGFDYGEIFIQAQWQRHKAMKCRRWNISLQMKSENQS